MDLSPFIDVTKSEILNAKGGLDDVFLRNPDDKASAAPKGIVSDCDPQLLLTLVFKEPIKLASLKFICPTADDAPRKIKLFVNKLNLGFSEVEEQTATQELTLTAKDVDPTADPLESATKVLTAKFAKVSSLTVFVSDNQADTAATVVSRIVLFGSSQSGAPPSNVKVINSPLEYNNYVKNSPGKTVVAYFHASWCTHCRTTGPLVSKLSIEKPDLIVMSIDVDKLKDTLPEAKSVASVPHFKLYQEGVEVQDFAGTPEILTNMLQKFEKD